MSKKFLAAGLVLVMILSLSLTGCGEKKNNANTGKGEVIEWSFYSPYGPEDSACCEIWSDLFKQIEEETDGQLVITKYWSGQHPYEGSDMLRVVDEGIAELAHFYGGYVASVEPVLGVDSLPLMYPADEQKAWEINKELWGDFSQDTSGKLEAILEKNWNASMVHMVPGTAQRLMTMGYDVPTADSLKGHKVRVYSAEFGKFVEALGGTPVSLTSSEVYTGLATNLIDGLITSVVFGFQGGYFDYTDTINTWEISQSSDGLMVSMEALNSLSDDVRETFTRIMKESALKPETKELDDNRAKVEELKAQGVKVVAPSEEERNKAAKKMEATVWKSWLESAGEEGQAIIDTIKSKQ